MGALRRDWLEVVTALGIALGVVAVELPEGVAVAGVALLIVLAGAAVRAGRGLVAAAALLGGWAATHAGAPEVAGGAFPILVIGCVEVVAALRVPAVRGLPVLWSRSLLAGLTGAAFGGYLGVSLSVGPELSAGLSLIHI